MAWFVNLSCVNAHSIICTSKLGAYNNILAFSRVAPCIYIVSRHSLARHVHLVVWHVCGEPW
jgi:hypothetical protein